MILNETAGLNDSSGDLRGEIPSSPELMFQGSVSQFHAFQTGNRKNHLWESLQKKRLKERRDSYLVGKQKIVEGRRSDHSSASVRQQ